MYSYIKKMDTPIRLLHGYLEPRMLLGGIHQQLNLMGYSDIKRIAYPSYHRSFPTMIQKAEDRVIESLEQPDQPVILIGHSLGGVVSSRFRRLNIRHSIMITSPLQGNFLVQNLQKIFGSWLAKLITGRAASFLDGDFSTPPLPYPYTTISAGLDFHHSDGIVSTEEMIIEPHHNLHLPNIDHLSILFSDDLYRMLQYVFDTRIFGLPIAEEPIERLVEGEIELE